MESVYFCDVCSKETINGKGELEVDFFNCNTKQKWLRHDKTAKHLKLCKKIEDDPMSIECKHCNQKFSQVGYAIHCTRNKSLWDMKKIGHSEVKDLTCNNIVIGKHRFATFDAYKKSLQPGPPSKRTAVGKWSPITGITRPPNKPKGWKDDKELQMKEHYSLCNRCDGMLNITTYEYSDKELMKITGLMMCDCEDEPNIQITIKEAKENLKEGEYVVINDTEEPTEEEYDIIEEYGTMLDFEEYCDTCNLPYSIRLQFHLRWSDIYLL